MRLPFVRFVGDVHGKLRGYFNRIADIKYSIQLGDMGFREEYQVLRANKWLDPTRHKILGGNHDDYLQENGLFVNQTEHFLGDSGIYLIPDFGKVFFVRGGRSIDSARRKEGRDWFRQEELNYKEGTEALVKYEEVKPELMISHECPEQVIHGMQLAREAKGKRIKTWGGLPILPSSTAMLLQGMFEVHQPKIWLFGHHHQSFNEVIQGTRFICLNELEYVDINTKLEIL